MPSDKTAVLFFSRTLNDEFGAKSLGLNRKRFSSLYKFFVNRTLQTVKDSGLPLIEFYSNQQVGNTFNERLVHSLRVVAEQGFQNVIIIGNDTPELSVDDLMRADKALQKGQNVLGRDSHGGVYLMGLNLDEAKSIDFKAIQWHSSFVYQQLCDQLEGVFILEAKSDLNTLEDFNVVLRLRTRLSRGFRLSLKRILFHKAERAQFFMGFSKFKTTTWIVRGPPQIAF
ncbi:hypothetical protein BFP97_00415 [Roseivirga sp. 4D4]|uniref:TIGR04282 family arsenosugar biosynthesis glycosyltransferase n=1 Tax=Roseivirga sp. 4D4 TaxID=1889784 RepID=UPI000852D379|nr:DUF2064 domain-containing protein [Roseivirga sp. 4D4]OEK00068.1 hypothetical protein BFP97_00415 [Roseivirga sp. 4D4]